MGETLAISEAQFEERADQIAHLPVNVYEIIIAETGGLLGLLDVAMLHCGHRVYIRNVWRSGTLPT